MNTKKLSTALIAVTLVTALVGTVYAFHSEKEATVVADSNMVAYPVNDRGLTYGTLVDAEAVGELPDLILAVATNGETGYIYRADYIESSRAANNREEAEAIMREYEQGAVKAFREYALHNAGIELDPEADTLIGEIIFRTNGIELSWDNLSEQQQAAVFSLFPEDTRTPELVQAAYAAAIGANDVSVPVYALDGETVIGELIVK